MTTNVFNTKISEVENKIPNVTGSVKKTDYNAKIKDVEGNYFTTADYNKFMSDILDAKIKQKELVNKFGIVAFVKKTHFHETLINLNKKVT